MRSSARGRLCNVCPIVASLVGRYSPVLGSPGSAHAVGCAPTIDTTPASGGPARRGRSPTAGPGPVRAAHGRRTSVTQSATRRPPCAIWQAGLLRAGSRITAKQRAGTPPQTCGGSHARRGPEGAAAACRPTTGSGGSSRPGVPVRTAAPGRPFQSVSLLRSLTLMCGCRPLPPRATSPRARRRARHRGRAACAARAITGCATARSPAGSRVATLCSSSWQNAVRL